MRNNITDQLGPRITTAWNRAIAEHVPIDDFIDMAVRQVEAFDVTYLKDGYAQFFVYHDGDTAQCYYYVDSNQWYVKY